MNIVLHVGWPKTGTTAFQRNVLLPFRGKVPIEGNNLSEDRWSVIDSFFNGKDVEKGFKRLMDGTTTSSGVGIYSEERLLLEDCSGRGFINAALRMRDLGTVKILAFIRNQGDWLRSFYSEVKNGSTMYDSFDYGPTKCYNSLSDWVDALIARKEAGQDKLLNFINYCDRYEALSEAFGRENITFLPYELLGRDLNYWAGMVSNVTNIAPEYIVRGMAVREYVSGARLHDHWAGALVGPFRDLYLVDRFISALRNKRFAQLILSVTSGSRVGDSSMMLDPAQSDYLRQLYCQGNGKMSEHLGLDLKSLGYWC